MHDAEAQLSALRTPASSMRDVLTVIGPDGRASADTDPMLEPAQIVAMYSAMVRTRIIDAQLEKLQRQGRIGFHVGSLGEEASIVGPAAALREQDWIFPCYREFGALLWRGFPLQTYIDNMYGNADDRVRGRQMPDHYTARDFRFVSVSSPVGTQITQGVGLAWAAKLKGDDAVSAVFFGEGATSSNDFHSGMNFAGVFKVPTIFLCRNNHWAISVPSERQTASDSFAAKGVAYGVPAVRCDGNDILATYAAVRAGLERARAGGGPTLIEMLTYRMGGHSTSDDPRAYRVQDEVEQWRSSDPVVRLRKHLDVLGAWSDAEDDELKKSAESELRACIERAEQKPKPPLATMFEDVYRDPPWHLDEQREEVERGPRPKAHH